MKRLFIQFFIFFIASQYNSILCQQIPVLNLASALERSEDIKLSDFVESITYIPLATTYNCLVDKNPKVYVSKEYIITLTIYRCLVFSRNNGEFIREIGRYGRGPGEFPFAAVMGFINDQSPACYFIGLNGNLVKYTIDGVFRGNINMPGYNSSFDKPSVPMNFSFINDSIIVCDFLIARGIEPYLLMIFNENGKVIKTIPNRNILGSKQVYVTRPGETSFYRFNNNLFFQNMYNDTVFRITVDKITPYFILNRGKHSPPYESKWWPLEKRLKGSFIFQPQYSESKRFISFNFYLDKIKYFALYDKMLRLLKVVDNSSGIKNDIDGFMNLTFDSMNSEGDLTGLIQANDIVHWIEKNPERFKAMDPGFQKLKSINMEDNPVIVIAKYKE